MSLHNFYCLIKSCIGKDYSKQFSRKKGFSLTEVTLALGIIGIFVTIITISIIRGQVTEISFNSDKIIVKELDHYTKIIAAQPFLKLYNNDYEIPDNDMCVGENISCPKVYNKIFRVSYEITKHSTNDSNEETVDYLEVKGSVNWEGADFTSVERVYAPTPNWRPGYGTIEIDFFNPSNLIIDSLYLVSSQTGLSVAVSEDISSNKAYLSVPLSACGIETEGCTLALQSDGSSGYNNITLDASSVLTSLKVSQDRLTQITSTLSSVSKVNLQLYAKNGYGEIGAPKVLNSICFYLIFHDGVKKRYLPHCNDTFPDAIIIDKYIPDPLRPWIKIAYGSEYDYELSMKSKNGECENINGMVSVSNGQWVNSSTCFYWNWGEPTYLSNGISLSNFGESKISFLSGINNLTLTWTAQNSSPASGGSFLQPLWSKARDMSNFNNPVTCTESNNNCNSKISQPPTLIGPRLGSYQIPGIILPNNSGYDFTLIIKDFDDVNNNNNNLVYLENSVLGTGSINKFETVDINGTPTLFEVPLSPGDLIAQSNNGYYAVPLRIYTGSSDGQSFTIKMTGPGGSSYEKIYLSNNPTPVFIMPESIVIDQGGTSSIKTFIINSHGEAASSVNVSATSSNSSINFDSAQTNSEGYAMLPINISAAKSDMHNITFNSGFVSTNKYIKVNSIPGSISTNYSNSNPLSISQGDEKPISISLLDKHGTPLSNNNVRLGIYRNNLFTSDVTIKNASCLTDSNGNCSVTIKVNKSAKSGQYLIKLKSGNIEKEIPLAAEQSVKNIFAPISTVIQGGESVILAKVLDGAGDPIANKVVTGSYNGFTFTPATTNSSGLAELSYTVGDKISKGEKKITLSSSNVSTSSYVRVTQKVAGLISAPIIVNQGGSVNSYLTIIDSNGDTVPNITLTAESSDGLTVKLEPSYTDGKSYIQISAPNTVTPASYLINMLYEGETIDILTVRVQRGIGSITSEGSLSSGDGTNLKLYVKDYYNSPIANRELIISSESSAILLGTLTNTSSPNKLITIKTNSKGYADLSIYAKPSYLSAPVILNITSSGSSYKVYIEADK